jgi:hypothetical protein
MARHSASVVPYQPRFGKDKYVVPCQQSYQLIQRWWMVQSSSKMIHSSLLWLCFYTAGSSAVYSAKQKLADPSFNGSAAVEFNDWFPGLLLARDSCPVGPKCSSELAEHNSLPKLANEV